MSRSPPPDAFDRVPDWCVTCSMVLGSLLLVVGTAAVFYAALLVPFVD
ncbi:hypothetical protein [Halorussus sp. AFM4]